MTQWRKASRSNTSGGDCVEVAHLGGGVLGIRDSKAPEAGHVSVGRGGLADLVAKIKDGRLDP